MQRHRKQRCVILGICISCSKSPLVNKRYCAECANKQAEHCKRYHKKRREKGICCDCRGIAATGKSRCKSCQALRNERLNGLYRDLKKRCVELLGGKCLDCNLVTEYYAAYDFHHPDPNVKEGNPAMAFGRKPDAMLKEITKCVLLCATCHRIRHAKGEL